MFRRSPYRVAAAACGRPGAGRGRRRARPGAPLAASTSSSTPSTPKSRPPRNPSRPRPTVRFTPLDDNVTSAAFELNNALNVSRVVDAKGKQIPASRNQQDSTVRLSFEQPLPKGQPVTVDVHLRRPADGAGRLAGLRHQVRGHPSRFRVPAVPGALVPGERLHHRPLRRRCAHHRARRVHRAGQRHRLAPGGRRQERLRVPVRAPVVSRQHRGGEGRSGVKVPSEGVTTTLYFRGDEKRTWRRPYGEEIGKMMSYFTGDLRPAALRQPDGGGDRRAARPTAMPRPA